MAKKTARAAATAQQQVIDDVPDLQLVRSDALTVTGFLANLKPFFLKARDLETSAHTTLAKAKTLKPPTNGNEDAAIQVFIRDSAKERKEATAFWSARMVFHRMNVAFKAKADVTIGALEKAEDTAQRLHNTYAEAERQRQAREQQEKQRIADEKARQERAAEVARLQAEADERELASADLSSKERLFVHAYTVDTQIKGNAEAAATRAGYKDALTMAARLMKLPKIQAAIQGAEEAVAIREQAAARAAQPLDVKPVEVDIDLHKAPGAHDRTTHSGEVVDAHKFVAACIAGGFGIPHDCLMPNPVKINEYARSLHERIQAWPGVVYKKTTKTV